MHKNRIQLHQILDVNSESKHITILEGNKNTIRGVRGHNSCFFCKPILRGKFYVEFIGSYPQVRDPSLKYAPQFRVGLAPTQYYFNYPLGRDHSIAYIMDGGLVSYSKKSQFGCPFQMGDVIGVGINIPQIYKDRNKSKICKENTVIFYKNGQKVGEELHCLTEDLYTFSVSTYNQAQVQINYEPDTIQYMPPGYRAYSQHLSDKLKYNDKQLQTYNPEVFFSYKRFRDVINTQRKRQ